MDRVRHTLTMVILCASGGLIYGLPYLFEAFYIPTQQALGVSKSQMGMLMGVFGAVSLVAYFPGGWLADRVSPRKLITIALLTTGVSGIYYATLPGYALALALHALWGISITLAFWGAMIKATRNWAPSEQQGRAFGILEGGRGLSTAIVFSLLLALFAWLGSTRAALASVILCYAAINIVLGLAAWVILDDGTVDRDDAPRLARSKVGWKEIRLVLRMPAVWLTALIIVATNCAYWASYYFTPYASDVFLLSVAIAGALAAGRNWISPVAAITTGVIADRFGISRTVAVGLLLTAISFLLFAMTPASQVLLPLVVVNGAVAALCIFGLRGIYFALLDEQGIPLALTGTAAGVISAVGFVPDIFMPVLGGALLDAYPGLPGYRLMFGAIAAMAVFGFLAACLIGRRQRADHAVGVGAT